MNVLWWAQVAFSDQYPLPILWKELFDFYLTSGMGSWCETQCGKGAARGYHLEGASLSSKPTTRQAELTGRGWTSESWAHGLVSAFSRTFKRSTYVHQIHPLFWIKSFGLCFWLVLRSKRSCDWHRWLSRGWATSRQPQRSDSFTRTFRFIFSKREQTLLL